MTTDELEEVTEPRGDSIREVIDVGYLGGTVKKGELATSNRRTTGERTNSEICGG